MPSLASRVLDLERLADRLADRGPKVSDMLREARQRTMAGEVPPAPLHDITVLERQAQGRGLAAEMARSQLRMLRGPPEALLLVRVAAENGRGEVGSMETPASVPTRSTTPTVPSTATSVSDAAIAKIDQLLARHV